MMNPFIFWNTRVRTPCQLPRRSLHAKAGVTVTELGGTDC
jgi:hypothetical protein